MSVVFAKGFRTSGVSSGLKLSGKLDTMLLVNEGKIDSSASVFTTNRVIAAPLQFSKKALCETNGKTRAFILNSGSANSCTGQKGLEQSEATAEFVSLALGLNNKNLVQVASTGKIGELIDLEKLFSGIKTAKEELSDTKEAGDKAAKAILTTDTFPKTATFESSEGYRIGGIVKGAGMIAPSMATMISIITTDAMLSPKELDKALKTATEYSFNRIDCDGCMSTNDTFLVLASGESGVKPNLDEFTKNLTDVAKKLAKQIVRDCEGASHDIKIKVINTNTEEGALEVARSVARSNLLKCALAGNDPNWGRILANIGVVSEKVAKFDQNEIDIYLNSIMVCKNGGIGEDKNKVNLKDKREIDIVIDLKSGNKEAELLTNDLTYEYVRINSEYTT